MAVEVDYTKNKENSPHTRARALSVSLRLSLLSAPLSCVEGARPAATAPISLIYISRQRSHTSLGPSKLEQGVRSITIYLQYGGTGVGAHGDVRRAHPTP